MSWNYRICTKLNGIREYKICEIYYDKNGKPNGYVESKATLCWDNKKDLVKTIELLSTVPDNTIYDLDNFPNLYVESKSKNKRKPSRKKV